MEKATYNYISLSSTNSIRIRRHSIARVAARRIVSAVLIWKSAANKRRRFGGCTARYEKVTIKYPSPGDLSKKNQKQGRKKHTYRLRPLTIPRVIGIIALSASIRAVLVGVVVAAGGGGFRVTALSISMSIPR